MMTKKDFKQLAGMCSEVNGEEDRACIIGFLCNFCWKNNNKFDENRFREWIRKLIAGKDLKDLN